MTYMYVLPTDTECDYWSNARFIVSPIDFLFQISILISCNIVASYSSQWLWNEYTEPIQLLVSRCENQCHVHKWVTPW